MEFLSIILSPLLVIAWYMLFKALTTEQSEKKEEKSFETFMQERQERQKREKNKEKIEKEKRIKERKEKVKKQKEEWLKNNPKPKNKWCGCEYVFYEYDDLGLYVNYNINIDPDFDWILKDYVQHKEHFSEEKGIKIEYCHAKNKMKKFKYKEVK